MKRPDNFSGIDITSPVNRIPDGKVAMAVNLRAYGEGQFEMRTELSAPIISLNKPVQSVARMNDTTPAGTESGYCLISVDSGGTLYVNGSAVGFGFSGAPVSIVPSRPNASVQPWAYIGDDSENVTISTRFALNGEATLFECFGQVKVRSDGLIYKTGIQEPPLAPTVTASNTIVVDSGPLLATAIPWTNYAGQNPNYDFGETNGPPNPGTPNPVDGTVPFIVNCANASTITITGLSGTATVNGSVVGPTAAGPAVGPTNPGGYVQTAGSPTPPGTVSVVVGAFTDGEGNVVPAGVAPLYVPSVVDIGAAFTGSLTIQVPSGAQSFQIGINSTGNTFNSNSGQFLIGVEVTTDSLPPTLGTLGPLSLYYWGDSPTSGPVASYIWKSPSDTGGGTPRSTSNAVGNTTGNSFIFDATFTAGIPSTPGTGTSVLPMQWYSLSAESAATGSSPVFPSPITATYPNNTNYNNFNFCLYGKIYVPAPGQYTFVLTNHDDCIWGIQGATLISATPGGSGEGGSVSLSGSGQTMTVAQGYPLLPRQNYTSGEGGDYAKTTVVVSFASAGVYWIEFD